MGYVVTTLLEAAEEVVAWPFMLHGERSHICHVLEAVEVKEFFREAGRQNVSHLLRKASGNNVLMEGIVHQMAENEEQV